MSIRSHSRSRSRWTNGWPAGLQRLRMLPGKRAHAKELLETTIGRLNHAAYVVPNSRPFLGRLCWASKRAQTCGSVKLSDSQVADLKLWEVILDAAAKGISIKCLVFRWQTWTVCVDSCPQGMGGRLQPSERNRLAPASAAGLDWSRLPELPQVSIGASWCMGGASGRGAVG